MGNFWVDQVSGHLHDLLKVFLQEQHNCLELFQLNLGCVDALHYHGHVGQVDSENDRGVFHEHQDKGQWHNEVSSVFQVIGPSKARHFETFEDLGCFLIEKDKIDLFENLVLPSSQNSLLYHYFMGILLLF